MRLLSLNRSGTYRSPQETAAERLRAIDNSGSVAPRPFPGPAQSSPSRLVSGRRLR